MILLYDLILASSIDQNSSGDTACYVIRLLANISSLFHLLCTIDDHVLSGVWHHLDRLFFVDIALIRKDAHFLEVALHEAHRNDITFIGEAASFVKLLQVFCGIIMVNGKLME